MNTAVPQALTILKRRDGFLVSDDDNEFIFNDDFVVIGQYEKGSLKKLNNSAQVKICETKGWKYDVDAVLIEEE